MGEFPVFVRWMMAQYRKRALMDEATQWKSAMYWDGTRVTLPGVKCEVVPSGGILFYVVTTHGQKAYLDEGDWIVTEPDGNGYYPCKPDIFAAGHEGVE